MPRSTSLNEQMRAESRDKIVASARHLFARHGFDRTSITDIARRAGMSQGNIYWYFPSKEALLGAVLADGFKTLNEMVVKVAAGSESGAQKLERLIKNFLDLARDEDGDEFITIVVSQIGQGGVSRLAELGSDAPQLGAEYSRQVSSILAQGQAEGTLLSDLDAELLTTFFFSFLNGLMFMYPNEWRDIPETHIRDAFLRLLGAQTK